MTKKRLCKIKYCDLKSRESKVEYGKVEESQIFSFLQEGSDFISVERPLTHLSVAIPKNLIEEIIMFAEIERIGPHFSKKRTAAEIC